MESKQRSISVMTEPVPGEACRRQTQAPGFRKLKRDSLVPVPVLSVSVRGRAGWGLLERAVSFTLVSGGSAASISNRYSDGSSAKAVERSPLQDHHSTHLSCLERKTLCSCINQAPCPHSDCWHQSQRQANSSELGFLTEVFTSVVFMFFPPSFVELIDIQHCLSSR